MKQILFGWLLVFLCNMAQAQAVDTFEVRFNLNDPKLTDKSKVYIDQLLSKNKIQRGQRLMILGYADYLGSEDDNKILSEKRATQVKEYLITSGFKNEDVHVCVGKGEIVNNATDKAGKPDDRKVQIIIDKGKGKGKNNAKTNGTTETGTPLFDIAVLKENDVIPLDHVFFESGSYEITDRSYFELGKVSSFLRKNPSVQVKIEGHICCGQWRKDGTTDVDTGLTGLSGKRAKAVYDFLVENAIDAGRLQYYGWGTTRPFVPREMTEDDEAKNRRVAIRILRK